jgi:hypothetical protein
MPTIKTITAHLSDMLDLLGQEVSQMTMGVNLLLAKQLSPALVNLTQLQLSVLRKMVQNHGLDTMADQLSFAYQLSTSFLAGPDGSSWSLSTSC